MFDHPVKKCVLFWFQGRPRAQRKSHESLVIEKVFGGKIPGCSDWLCILLSPLNGREFSSPSSKRTGILEVRVKFFEALCLTGADIDGSWRWFRVENGITNLAKKSVWIKEQHQTLWSSRSFWIVSNLCLQKNFNMTFCTLDPKHGTGKKPREIWFLVLQCVTCNAQNSSHK